MWRLHLVGVDAGTWLRGGDDSRDRPIALQKEVELSKTCVNGSLPVKLTIWALMARRGEVAVLAPVRHELAQIYRLFAALPALLGAF